MTQEQFKKATEIKEQIKSFQKVLDLVNYEYSGIDVRISFCSRSRIYNEETDIAHFIIEPHLQQIISEIKQKIEDLKIEFNAL